jgi:signal transduction histidine kinase
MHSTIAIHVLVDVLNISLGIYVLSKNPGSIVHRSFFAFAIGIASWSLGILLVSFTGDFFFVTVALWGGELVVLGLVVFARTFGGAVQLSPLRDRAFLWSLAPLCALFLISPFHLILRTAAVSPRGYLEPENGPLFPFFAAVLGVYVAWGLWQLIVKYRTSNGVAHVQLRYVIAGAGIFLGGALVFDVFLPALHIFSLNLLGPLGSVTFIGCTAYAIVRHELLDIRVVIKKGITYALLVLALMVIFVTLEFAIEKFIYPNDEVVDIVVATAGVLLFARLKDLFSRATDRIFFRGDYEYTAAVRELGTFTSAAIDPRKLFTSLADLLMRTVKPSQAMLFLKGGKETVTFGLSHDAKASFRADEYRQFAERCMASCREPTFLEEGADTLGIAAAIPFIVNGKVTGVMLLGGKLSEDIYRSKDIELLRVIAHHAGVAMENARLYDEVKRYNDELEMRVRERTEKMRAMQEAQSKFLADISHELQTPVAILKGNMEIVERKRKGDRKIALQVMGSAAERMAQMVEHLLAIARLNFSKQKLYKERFPVENLLEEIYHDCVALTEDKEVVLSYEAREPLMLFADKEKLRAVILNLVSNALKHTPRGGTISMISEGVGERICISVRDTGFGIAPEDLPLIFERLYRIEGDEAAGTGLGLDIVKKIIEAHGGVITVKSELRQGSCFTLLLPAGLA